MKIDRKLKTGRRRGFTLVELVVTIVILGIIAAIAIPTYYGITENANKKMFETNHNIIVSGLNMYISAHNGAYPPTPEALMNGKYIAAEKSEYDINGNVISFFEDQPKGAKYELTIVSNGFKLYSTYPTKDKVEEKEFSRGSLEDDSSETPSEGAG